LFLLLLCNEGWKVFFGEILPVNVYHNANAEDGDEDDSAEEARKPHHHCV